MKIEIGGCTGGGPSHPVNEDRLMVEKAVLCFGQTALRTDGPTCVAVFDGVSEGGFGAGAASLAGEVFSSIAFWRGAQTVEDLRDGIVLAGERAEDAVERYRRAVGTRIAAATVAGLVMLPSEHNAHAAIFNAGDSRVYRLRGGIMKVCSNDHTPERRQMGVSSMYGQDGVSHVIERAIGLADGGRKLEVSTSMAFPGDVFCVCSDGVDGPLGTARLKDLLARDMTPLAMALDLRSQARALGSDDDATVAIVKIGE